MTRRAARSILSVAVIAAALVGVVAVAGPVSATSTTWTQLTPSTSPPARQDASMAYDSTTGNMVLFGGAGVLKGATYHQ